jgi:serine/threonine protein phosphatase PrpC
VQLSLRYSVQSTRGLRPNNEDAAFAGPRLLALADGMGGHAAGEVAASLVVSELSLLNEHPVDDPVIALREAAHRGNDAIARDVTKHPEHGGMGTTLTAMLFTGQSFGLVHVGDSRAYLFREGALTQITKDDTLVGALVDEGRLTPEQAREHPQRSMVLRVLTGQDVELFVERRATRIDDRYLICSDGLSDYVPDDAIGEALTLDDPHRSTQELIRLALLGGSRDNITCVVTDVIEGASGYNMALLAGAPGFHAVLVDA